MGISQERESHGIQKTGQECEGRPEDHLYLSQPWIFSFHDGFLHYTVLKITSLCSEIIF